MMKLENKMVGGILLIAGTAIGAGILALPVVTGFAGFFPTLLLFLIYWGYMTFTALLLLEVNLVTGEQTNLISMARATLGRTGELISWTFYLLLLYLLLTAYLAGSSPVILYLMERGTGWDFPNWTGSLPLIALIGFFVFEGTKYVDYLNRILMAGLIVSYFVIIGVLTPTVNSELLARFKPLYLVMGLSLVATSFGFHIIIPTLTTYLRRHAGQLKKSIIIGSTIPLIVYIIWEAVILGNLSVKGERGIAHGYYAGKSGIQLMVETLGHGKMALLVHSFSFFAIITSFLGVSKSLMDFLSDGLQIKKTLKGRLLLTLLALTPPFVIMLTYPRAFLLTLEYAGAYGVVILLGLLPSLMAWSSRYYKRFPSPYVVPGGKPSLILAIAFSLFVVGVEIAMNFGWFNQLVESVL